MDNSVIEWATRYWTGDSPTGPPDITSGERYQAKWRAFDVLMWRARQRRLAPSEVQGLRRLEDSGQIDPFQLSDVYEASNAHVAPPRRLDSPPPLRGITAARHRLKP